MEFLSKLFKAAGNENRLKILKTFEPGKTKEIGEVAQSVNLPYKTTARNLKILEKFDFLESNFYKGTVYYRLKNNRQHFYNQQILRMIERSKS